MGLRLLLLVMLPKRIFYAMLPKQVPLQIYVQETLQKFARFYIVTQIAAFHGCDVSIRRRLMIILIVVHGFPSHFLPGSCVLHLRERELVVHLRWASVA